MLFLEQSFERASASPELMDRLWAHGWRHFGTHFFRYSIAWHGGRWRTVMPLRIDLDRFTPSRSQRRILAKNRDVQVVIRDTVIDEEKERMFYGHIRRFRERVPSSLYDFFSHTPASVPCRNEEICVYLNERLIAASFLDIGETATSGVYAMFDEAEARRSLGIFTILAAMRYSRERGCRYYYPGYAYHEPSFYDYKKNFAGLEYLDWEQGWQPLSRGLQNNEAGADVENVFELE
jgi:arginine-tRNA-protein transferase